MLMSNLVKSDNGPYCVEGKLRDVWEKAIYERFQVTCV